MSNFTPEQLQNIEEIVIDILSKGSYNKTWEKNPCDAVNAGTILNKNKNYPRVIGDLVLDTKTQSKSSESSNLDNPENIGCFGLEPSVEEGKLGKWYIWTQNFKGERAWQQLSPGLQGEKGEKGDKGDRGEVGPTNTLTIGNVQLGVDPNAELIGHAPDQTLNLILPQGSLIFVTEEHFNNDLTTEYNTTHFISGINNHQIRKNDYILFKNGLKMAIINQVNKIEGQEEFKYTIISPFEISLGGGNTTVTINNLPVAEVKFDSDPQQQITTNTNNIATNTANIATNAGNIIINAGNIATNKTNIATNKTNIATNKANIATNTSNIATNTSNIATNTENIATNTENIATNTENIATNTENIATNTEDINNLKNNKVNTADVINIAHGGTAATSKEQARTNLGLGTAAVQNIEDLYYKADICTTYTSDDKGTSPAAVKKAFDGQLAVTKIKVGDNQYSLKEVTGTDTGSTGYITFVI